MSRLTSPPRRRGAFGWLMAVAIVLAACAAGLWLVLRIAPPVPWRLDIGLLAHNLVPRSPLPPADGHRRASRPSPEPDDRSGVTPQSGQRP